MQLNMDTIRTGNIVLDVQKQLNIWQESLAKKSQVGLMKKAAALTDLTLKVEAGTCLVLGFAGECS